MLEEIVCGHYLGWSCKSIQIPFIFKIPLARRGSRTTGLEM